MKAKLAQYLRDRLGISARLARLQNEQEKQARLIKTLASALNMQEGEVFAAEANLLARVKKTLAEEFGIGEFNGLLHRNDLMLWYHLHHTAPDTLWGLSSYFRVGLRFVKQVRNYCEREHCEPQRILDFGSGYGRMSRFLPHFFDATIIPTEIKAEAMRFQEETFGFSGITHTPDPGSFTSQPADLIMALSVFSHLREADTQAWIQTLMDVLNPGGRFLLSYHPVRGPREYEFKRGSEDELLPLTADHLSEQDQYGVSFISDNFWKKLAGNNGWQVEFLNFDFNGDQKALCLKHEN